MKKYESLPADPLAIPPKKKSAAEHYRLAGRKPLLTVLLLSIGPLLSQITSALYGIVSTIWVSKYIGEIGMTSISTATAFDNIGRAFGFFISTAGSSKISALYGAGLEAEAGQVMCDLIRMCLVFGVFVPACLVPAIKPAFRWFGAPEDVVDMAYDYLFPLVIMTVTTCMYLGSLGFLQGEGRSLLSGAITIVSGIINMAALNPFLIKVCKLDILGASMATIIAEGIPGIVVIVLFFCGVFGVKPYFKQLFQKFSPHTWSALRVGLSQLVANLSISVPGIIVRKLIGLCAGDDGTMFKDSLAGFNVVFRYSQVTNSVINAITMGFLPPASYANAAGKYKRWLRLAFHALWINLAWGTLTTIFSWTIPKQLSLIFADGEGYLRWAIPMMQIGNALGFFTFSRFNFPSMLQSLMMGITATLLSLASQLFAMLGFSLLMYYTDKTQPIRITWCYSLSYAFGFFIGAFVLWRPVYNVWKKSTKELPEEEELVTNDSTN